MKKVMFLVLCGVLMAITVLNAANKPLCASPESIKLSNDPQFVKSVNLITSFSADIYSHKKLDALNRYSSGLASETDVYDITEATGIENIKYFFSEIANLRKIIKERYSFMTNNENGNQIIEDAMVNMAKAGKLEKLKNIDVDCLASFMAAFGLCYWAYDLCFASGQPENNCAVGVTACLTLAFISADQCFDF